MRVHRRFKWISGHYESCPVVPGERRWEYLQLNNEYSTILPLQ